MGFMKGDTRSLDYSSCNGCAMVVEGGHRVPAEDLDRCGCICRACTTKDSGLTAIQARRFGHGQVQA